jgi:GT2 family glycosyltransferase
MHETTLVLISYKSENKIYELIKRTPKDIKIIIIENSNNREFKKNIENKYKNITVYIKNNEGVSSSLNFAVKYIETKYFLQISPDINFNFDDLKLFLDLAKNLHDKFAAIGPRFEDVKEKSHKQINKDLRYGHIKSIHGSCMFINKKNFIDIGGFDENFFLYFEETEFCYRAKKKGYLSYQLNKSKVSADGRSIEINNMEEKNRISNILIWHFIWSKFYFSKKKYGKFFSIILFTPIIIRIIFKIFIYRILKDQIYKEKYIIRLNGLMASFKGKKSSLRPY